MGKRLEYTPNSQIKSALRKLWLRSRERGKAIKRDHYTCVRCGKKQSKAKGREIKVEVHHKKNVLNWGELYITIRKFLLCSADDMETLCEDCHEEEK